MQMHALKENIIDILCCVKVEVRMTLCLNGDRNLLKDGSIKRQSLFGGIRLDYGRVRRIITRNKDNVFYRGKYDPKHVARLDY